MGMIKMDMDGFLSNCTKDYVKFRERLDELLADANDEEREEFLSQADEIHDNLVFLVDTIKLPSNDPDANKLEGVKLGLDKAAFAARMAMETHKAEEWSCSQCAAAIRALDAAAIVKKGM